MLCEYLQLLPYLHWPLAKNRQGALPPPPPLPALNGVGAGAGENAPNGDAGGAVDRPPPNGDGLGAGAPNGLGFGAPALENGVIKPNGAGAADGGAPNGLELLAPALENGVPEPKGAGAAVDCAPNGLGFVAPEFEKGVIEPNGAGAAAWGAPNGLGLLAAGVPNVLGLLGGPEENGVAPNAPPPGLAGEGFAPKAGAGLLPNVLVVCPKVPTVGPKADMGAGADPKSPAGVGADPKGAGAPMFIALLVAEEAEFPKGEAMGSLWA